MGKVTFQQFKDRLQVKLGNMGYDDGLVGQWVNAGVQEVAGAVDFDSMKVSGTVDIVDGTYEYLLDEDIITIVSLGWIAEDRWIIKSTPEALLRFNRDESGLPRYWAKRGNTLILYPTPDRSGTLDFVSVSDVELMVAAGDVSPFPATWDEAIYRFAVSAALFDLDDEEGGLLWHDRAVKYAGSRITDAEYGSEAISMPVRVATRLSDLNIGSKR